MQQGLAAYGFDVPDGEYEIELRFVETEFKEPGRRVFHVRLNGETVAEQLDIVRACGALRACARRFRVRATGGGVRVDFVPVTGKPILSAVRIRKS